MSTSPVGFGRPLSHVGYAVSDIERAAHAWAAAVGAGPFFLLGRMTFDSAVSDGAPARWDHSAAFGQWGSIAIELQQMHDTAPERLATALDVPPPAINHVAYVTDTPEAESERLAAAGHALVLHATSGPIDLRFHEGHGQFGHAIEIHRRTDFLVDAFKGFAEAADGWDGRDPLRTLDLG